MHLNKSKEGHMQWFEGRKEERNDVIILYSKIKDEEISYRAKKCLPRCALSNVTAVVLLTA